MKYLAIAFLALSLNACYKDPMRTESTDNPEVPVSLLFEKDGCKVYRFYDNRSHYFVKCENSSATISSQSYSCGKSVCVRDEEITTSYTGQ